MTSALVVNQGDRAQLTGLVLATPGSETADPGVRLTLAENIDIPRVAAEPRVGTDELGASENSHSVQQSAADLLWHLNWLRNQAGLFGFDTDERLKQIAVAYCPELANYFDENYDPDRSNWAEAMVHDAEGADLAARTAESGYGGWTNELLAWTQDSVDLSLVARGFWDAPTHATILTSPDPTHAGAAICRGDDGYLYVVVIGADLSPFETSDELNDAEPVAPHNPFIIP